MSEDVQWLRSVVVAHVRDTPVPPPTADWVDVATRAGLLGLAVAAVEASGHPVPAAVAAARLGGAALHLRTLADLGAVADVLDPAGVRWLVFKGPVLAAVVHRGPLTRTYADLDVLVHPADLRRALDALEVTAELLDVNWELLARSRPAEVSLRLPHGTALDLHWHVVNNPRTRTQLRVRPGPLLERRVPVTLGARTHPALDPVDTVLQVALHASLSGAHTLRWMLDLQQAVAWSGASAAQLAGRADELGLALVLRSVLQRAGSILDPQLEVLAQEVAPANPWTWLSARAAALAPPGSDLDGRPTGRLVAQSTRTSTASSAAQLVRHAARMARHRVRPLPGASLADLRRPAGTRADRDAWITHAESWA